MRDIPEITRYGIIWKRIYNSLWIRRFLPSGCRNCFQRNKNRNDSEIFCTFEGDHSKTTSYEEEKNFHPDNAPYRKSMKTVAKFNKLGFDLLPHFPYSPGLSSSYYWLFADLKKCSREKNLAKMRSSLPKLKFWLLTSWLIKLYIKLTEYSHVRNRM